MSLVLFFIRSVVVVLILMAPALMASALRVSPLYVELETSGTRSSFTMQISNPEDVDVPVEVYVERIIVGRDGVELSAEPADDDFIIFPPQSVLPANGRRALRVQYIGDGELAQSAHYRLVVSKVPVELEAGSTDEFTMGINFVIRFGVTVNVTPLGATSNPSIEFVGKTLSVEGEDRYVFRVSNPGSRHFYLSQSDIVINDAGQIKRFSGESIRTQVGGTLVPADGVREFELRLDGLSSDEVTARLD